MGDSGREGVSDAPSLLRELHHRVKNNFQIIASLINLKKRAASPSQAGDLRFLEEHVMVMAAAHRLVFASRNMMEVDLAELVAEVAEGLRVIAALPAASLKIESEKTHCGLALDQAVALGLYLAVTLPPYLNRAGERNGQVTVQIFCNPPQLVITPQHEGDVELDALRQRLMAAYVRQLGASARHDLQNGRTSLQFSLRETKSAQVS